MVISICNQKPEFSPQFMRQRWFNADAGDGSATFERLATQCSYGKWQFSPADNIIVPVNVSIPCNSTTGPLGAWSASTCRDVDRLGWAAAADDWVRKNTDINPDDFVHRFLLLPTQTANCNPAIAALAMQVGLGAVEGDAGRLSVL
ncbi:hypothetical protein GPECTOR_14g58 [Gonium pectorale]|uniref:Uncharacterized protein n=1 Tax=Gonium pectorale TaxID=33097 RepID=A0A150GMK5_GONPE|nr:hypothetical protein GPECTOR_14g58 [Gonium pectorale]|eukprot:KXZ51073.1 hypothetical protein GPECTOR_14g58 [Gonium pectorale]